MKKDMFRVWVKAIEASCFGILVSVISILVAFNYFINIKANNHANSRLLKTANNPTVYYVSPGGIKMPFPNADIFLSYKNKWQDIQVVSEAEISIYPDVEYIKLGNRKKIYWLQNNVKRLIDDKLVKQKNITDEQVIVVNKKEFEFYKTGAVVATEEIKSNQKNNTETENKCVPNKEAGGDEGCKIFTALEAGDIKLCYEISGEVWRAKCFTSFTHEKEKVLAECKTLQNENLRDECFSQVALTNEDKLICENLSNKNEKAFCESKVAIKQKQLTACDNLNSGDGAGERNYCWFVQGSVNNNLEACKKIDAQSKYKQPCNEILNQKVALQKLFKPQAVGIFAHLLKIKTAQAQSVVTGEFPVGGKFLPGAFDIYTPTPIPPCMLVTVIGPRPGTFNFFPTFIYDYFLMAPTHINLNMLGMARIFPPCPPTLYLVGSGLRAEGN
jgi:hypothetical protein